MPWENGAWFGSISEAEQKAGGAWVMGDRPHCDEPAFPGLTDGIYKPSVKIWYANLDRYALGRYSPKNRMDAARDEYVRVLQGRLDCRLSQFSGDLIGTWRLEYPAEGLCIPPEWWREWWLADGVVDAGGITVLFCEHDLVHGVGQSVCQCELHCWDTASVTSLLTLEAPVNQKEWGYQLIVPFVGSCFLSLGSCSPNRPVLSGEYVFLRRRVRERWQVQPSLQARGVVIYF